MPLLLSWGCGYVLIWWFTTVSQCPSGRSQAQGHRAPVEVGNFAVVGVPARQNKREAQREDCFGGEESRGIGEVEIPALAQAPVQVLAQAQARDDDVHTGIQVHIHAGVRAVLVEIRGADSDAMAEAEAAGVQPPPVPHLVPRHPPLDAAKSGRLDTCHSGHFLSRGVGLSQKYHSKWRRKVEGTNHFQPWGNAVLVKKVMAGKLHCRFHVHKLILADRTLCLCVWRGKGKKKKEED